MMKELSFYDELQELEPEAGFTTGERLSSMERPLLAWYGGHARILPWREEPEPYRVWISEIMLQQTRVEAVKPYFKRFMEALPDVRALAAVSEDRLLKLWEGLGYYNRARNLKKAAILITEEYGGVLPGTTEELMKLPGIGSYTAGAIASIAYGKAVPAVDGNVLRVISRVLGSREDIARQTVKTGIERLLSGVIPENAASSYNQALIEVGAIVCVPNGEPLCGACPLSSACIAGRAGLTGEIPVKTKAKARRIEAVTVFLLHYGGRTAIRRRKDTGLLASLYELPNAEGHLKEADVERMYQVPAAAMKQLRAAKHIFSHVEWHMMGYEIDLQAMPPGDYVWVTGEELKETYSLPGAFKAYTKLIR